VQEGKETDFTGIFNSFNPDDTLRTIMKETKTLKN
jgi:hypothetical protein